MASGGARPSMRVCRGSARNPRQETFPRGAWEGMRAWKQTLGKSTKRSRFAFANAMARPPNSGYARAENAAPVWRLLSGAPLAKRALGMAAIGIIAPGCWMTVAAN